MPKYNIIYKYDQGEAEFYLCYGPDGKNYEIVVTQSASTVCGEDGIDRDVEEMSISVEEIDDEQWAEHIEITKYIAQQEYSCNLDCTNCKADHGIWCQFHPKAVI